MGFKTIILEGKRNRKPLASLSPLSQATPSISLSVIRKAEKSRAKPEGRRLPQGRDREKRENKENLAQPTVVDQKLPSTKRPKLEETITEAERQVIPKLEETSKKATKRKADKDTLLPSTILPNNENENNPSPILMRVGGSDALNKPSTQLIESTSHDRNHSSQDHTSNKGLNLTLKTTNTTNQSFDHQASLPFTNKNTLLDSGPLFSKLSLFKNMVDAHHQTESKSLPDNDDTDAKDNNSILLKYAALEEKYLALVNLRETKAEEIFSLYKASTESRMKGLSYALIPNSSFDIASEDLIQKLSSEVDSLTNEIQTLKDPSNKQIKMDVSNSISALVEKNELYFKLTNLKVSKMNTTNDHRDVWHCIQYSKETTKFFEYQLIRDADLGTFECNPLTTLVHHLPPNMPEWISESIEFPEHQLPIFFLQIFNWLMDAQ